MLGVLTTRNEKKNTFKKQARMLQTLKLLLIENHENNIMVVIFTSFDMLGYESYYQLLSVCALMSLIM